MANKTQLTVGIAGLAATTIMAVALGCTAEDSMGQAICTGLAVSALAGIAYLSRSCCRRHPEEAHRDEMVKPQVQYHTTNYNLVIVPRESIERVMSLLANAVDAGAPLGKGIGHGIRDV